MQKMLVPGLIAALGISFASSADADILASCGTSEGHAYYLESGLLGAGDAGFRTDGISDGGTSLSVTDESVDILYRDATGQISSSAGVGGTVVPLTVNAELVHILVVYNNENGSSVESYIFDRDSEELVWTQSRVTGAISKAVVFRAPCEFFMAD